MKPIERTGHLDVWICIKQNVDGTLYFDQTFTTGLGGGMFKTLEEAQHHQTIALLKNQKLEIFHIEWPL